MHHHSNPTLFATAISTVFAVGQHLLQANSLIDTAITTVLAASVSFLTAKAWSYFYPSKSKKDNV